MVVVVRWLFIKQNILDVPNYRKVHQFQTPLSGGFSILSTLLIIIYYLNLNFSEINLILLATVFVGFFGLLDDIKPHHWSLRVASQAVAILFVIFFGEITIKSTGSFAFFDQSSTSYFGITITFIAVLGLTNAINLSDGIDGLASSLVLLPIILILLFASSPSIYDSILWVISGSIIAFLAFNVFSEKMKIFLGDSGSLALGFLLSWVLIIYANNDLIKDELVIWLTAMPVIDTFGVIYRRLQQGKKIFKPDNSHLHHLLIKSGFSKKETLILIILLSIFTSLIGYFATEYLSSFSYLIFLLLIPIYSGIIKNPSLLRIFLFSIK